MRKYKLSLSEVLRGAMLRKARRPVPYLDVSSPFESESQLMGRQISLCHPFNGSHIYGGASKHLP